MGKRKPMRRANRRTGGAVKPAPAGPGSGPVAAPDDPISYSALSLHDLFEQQARQMLDRADLDEEQKQNILVAMNCPCCGAGALSFTAKLKR
jgi:hypothetical protein